MWKEIRQVRKIPRNELLDKEKSQGNDSKQTFNVTYYTVFRNPKSQLKEAHVILAVVINRLTWCTFFRWTKEKNAKKTQSSSNFQTLILCLLDIFWPNFMSCTPGVPKFWPFCWRRVKNTKFMIFFIFTCMCIYLLLSFVLIPNWYSKIDGSSLFYSNKYIFKKYWKTRKLHTNNVIWWRHVTTWCNLLVFKTFFQSSLVDLHVCQVSLSNHYWFRF